MTGTRNRTPLVLAVGLVVVGLVAAAVVWVAAPFGDALAPGDTRDLEAPVWGRSATVTTPGGDVELLVGEPVERVDGQLVDGDSRTDDLVSERGDRLVAVSWARRLPTVAAAAAQVLPTPENLTVEVTLRVGGREFDLDTTTAAGTPSDWQHRVFAVPGTPSADDVAIDVTYDGFTQTVRGTGEVDRGRAAPLTRPERVVTPGTCAMVGSGELDAVALPCSVGPVTLLPYVGGQGWVGGEDETFAVAPVEIDSGPSLGDGSAPSGHEVIAGDVTATLDGQPAVSSPGGTDATYRGVLVFRVSGTPEELELSRELLLVPDAPSRPARRVTLTARLPLSP